MGHLVSTSLQNSNSKILLKKENKKYGEKVNNHIKQKINLTSAKIKILIMKILSKQRKSITGNTIRKVDGHGRGSRKDVLFQ